MREVTYTISAILHFNDGINKGNFTVKAVDDQDAYKKAIEKMKIQWHLPESKIDIIKVRRG